eukprot:9110393-Pyramimonas_sp.AAC.1
MATATAAQGQEGRHYSEDAVAAMRWTCNLPKAGREVATAMLHRLPETCVNAAVTEWQNRAPVKGKAPETQKRFLIARDAPQ